MVVIEAFGLSRSFGNTVAVESLTLAVEAGGDTNYLFITWSRHA